MQLAAHPELRGQQEVVLLGLAPVDHPHRLDSGAAVLLGYLDLHAILEQPVDLQVGVHRQQLGAVSGQLLDGLLQSIGGQLGVELLQGHPQPRHQHHLLLGLPSLARYRTRPLPVEIGSVPAQISEQLDGGLLDQGILGVGISGGWRGRHAASTSLSSGMGMSDTSISPETSLGSSRSRWARRLAFLCCKLSIRLKIGLIASSKRDATALSGATTFSNLKVSLIIVSNTAP